MELFALSRRTIPVGSQQTGHSLSLIFTVLIFLLSLVSVCIFIFSQGFQSWGRKQTRFTIEIPVSLQDFSPEAHDRKVQKVIQHLGGYKEIAEVTPVAPEKLREMLNNWVGESQADSNFPVPTLLDVTLKTGQTLDLEVLRQHLRKVSSDIVAEDHNTWSRKLVVFGKSLRMITLLIGAFIVLCVSVVVGLVTKSSLQVYGETLDILRLLGARNSYISRLFQRQILHAALWGGFWGILLSVPTAYAFVVTLKYLGLSILAENFLIWPVLALIVSVPFVVALLGLVISRLTIVLYLRALDR